MDLWQPDSRKPEVGTRLTLQSLKATPGHARRVCTTDRGVATGSSISWVAMLQGANNSECKLSQGWSRSDREKKILLSTGCERS